MPHGLKTDWFRDVFEDVLPVPTYVAFPSRSSFQVHVQGPVSRIAEFIPLLAENRLLEFPEIGIELPPNPVIFRNRQACKVSYVLCPVIAGYRQVW